MVGKGTQHKWQQWKREPAPLLLLVLLPFTLGIVWSRQDIASHLAAPLFIISATIMLCSITLNLLSEKYKNNILTPTLTCILLAFSFGWHYTNLKPDTTYNNRDLPQYVIDTRNKIDETLRRAEISQQNIALLKAITIADKSGISKQDKNTFIKCGAYHLLVVSGLHAGIIYSMVLFLLSFIFPTKNGIKHTLAISAIWMYAALTNWGAPVIRAALMISVYTVIHSFTKQHRFLHAITATLLLQLTINPHSLFNIGLWFSYGAVLGIVCTLSIYSRLTNCVMLKNKGLRFANKWLIIPILVSLSAQCTILPLQLTINSSMPLWFIINNLILLPIIWLCIWGTMIILAFSFIPPVLPYLGKPLNWLTGTAVSYADRAQQFDMLNFNSTASTATSIAMFAAIILLLLTFYNHIPQLVEE